MHLFVGFLFFALVACFLSYHVRVIWMFGPKVTGLILPAVTLSFIFLKASNRSCGLNALIILIIFKVPNNWSSKLDFNVMGAVYPFHFPLFLLWESLYRSSLIESHIPLWKIVLGQLLLDNDWLSTWPCVSFSSKQSISTCILRKVWDILSLYEIVLSLVAQCCFLTMKVFVQQKDIQQEMAVNGAEEDVHLEL